jgi:hypothetical protein
MSSTLTVQTQGNKIKISQGDDSILLTRAQAKTLYKVLYVKLKARKAA